MVTGIQEMKTDLAKVVHVLTVRENDAAPAAASRIAIGAKIRVFQQYP
jgi:hypothetical protein